MDYELILIRYGELSLKSTYVRNQFELKLVRNIEKAFILNNLKSEIKRERGRIYLKTEEITKGLHLLTRVFGITSFSPTIKTTSDVEKISETAQRISQKILKKDNSFALRVTRTGEHDYSSQDIAKKIGSDIIKTTKASVNLTKPDFKLFIEVRNNNAYLFTEKICGMGGLPLGTQGKVLALIDSPKSILAAWYLMRRGCKILFLKTNDQIADPLHSFITNWYAEPDIIEGDLKEKNLYETINKIAPERSCDALVTGHTIHDTSQDALSDIKQLKQHISLPVLHPLIAMDPDEIDKKCKEIGIST